MRTITLELLRHGPPHNQLLSPLTQYLALCENHPPVTLTLPFEHNQFLYRLKALAYQIGEEARTFQLHDTARELGALLGRIPGLIAELSRGREDDLRETGDGERARGSRPAMHVRLVLSASELALLPWELATAPDGCPGSGEHLLLQSQDPISLTRAIRRVTTSTVRWSRKPRILFIAASPPEVGPIPFRQHLRGLRKLIEPWVGIYGPEEHRDKLEKRLVIIKDATAERIGEACAKHQFTHVHILAHGVSYTSGFDTRFGIALHDPSDPDGKSDYVSGERLATLLRAARAPACERLGQPLAVTLAACNAGNVGSVSGVGASIAHALHDAGIPVVVASQFPLSFAGSVVMLKVLYEGLLWGHDPRLMVRELTRRLHANVPTSHDWASVTVYASLPADLEARLVDAQIEQTRRAIDVAMAHSDAMTEQLDVATAYPDATTEPAASNDARVDRSRVALRRARRKIKVAAKRLVELGESPAISDDQRARILGLRASMEKRLAELLYWSAREGTQRNGKEDRQQDPADLSAWRTALKDARRDYWESYLAARGNPWGAIQYLSLQRVLARLHPSFGGPDLDEGGEQKDPATLWRVAHALALADLGSNDPARASWAYGNLIELCLLQPEGITPDVRDQALTYARELVSRVGSATFHTHSTRRQIYRYVHWYDSIADLGGIADEADAILRILPESERKEWDLDHTGREQPLASADRKPARRRARRPAAAPAR